MFRDIDGILALNHRVISIISSKWRKLWALNKNLICEQSGYQDWEILSPATEQAANQILLYFNTWKAKALYEKASSNNFILFAFQERELMLLDSFLKIFILIFIAQTLSSQNKLICTNELFKSSAEPVPIAFCQKDYYQLKQLKYLNEKRQDLAVKKIKILIGRVQKKKLKLRSSFNPSQKRKPWLNLTRFKSFR